MRTAKFRNTPRAAFIPRKGGSVLFRVTVLRGGEKVRL